MSLGPPTRASASAKDVLSVAILDAFGVVDPVCEKGETSFSPVI
jgi:hypothetical protein